MNMSAAAEKLWMSEADYLDWESRAKDKHEYVAGEIFAMAGASERHNRIVGNLFFHWLNMDSSQFAALCNQQFQEGSEQAFTPDAGIVNELKKA